MKQLYTQTQQANFNRHDSFEAATATLPILGGTQRSARIASIFPIRNKSKAPPGRTSPPRAVVLIPAAASAGSEKSHASFKKNNKTHNQSTNIKSLSIMKKQILILVVIVLAAFANVNKSYGQIGLSSSPTCATAKPITATCVDNGLTPVAGVEYTYTVDVPTPPGTKTYHWLVTKDQTFIDAGSFVANPEVVATSDVIIAAGTGYNTATADLTSIDITWDYFVHDDNNPVFLVVYVTNDDACDNDNIEVYIIKPSHSFTLDVANVGVDGATITDGGNGPCAANVASAKYDVPSQTVLMNYGINYLFFSVTAANFKDSWLPSFQVSGDGITGTTGDRSVTAIDWQYSAQATTATGWNGSNISNAAGLYTGVATTAVAASSSGGTVGSDGECIIVRVTIDNGRIETITNAAITFAVDGIMKDPTATVAADFYTNTVLGDVHHTASATPTDPCPWVDGFVNDRVTQNITPRPNINEVIPDDPAFVPKN